MRHSRRRLARLSGRCPWIERVVADADEPATPVQRQDQQAIPAVRYLMSKEGG